MPVLAEFTLFLKLCVELRAKIWDFASQEPNLVLFDSYKVLRKMKYPRRKANTPISDRDKIFCGRHPYYLRIRRLSAVSKVPAILMTCHESRFWAMKHYSLCFEDQLYHRALWFNPTFDTIIFADINACWSFVYGGCFEFDHGSIPLIQNSFIMPVVERIVVQDSIHTAWYLMAGLMAQSFPHLKSLVIRSNNFRLNAQLFHERLSLTGRREFLPSFRLRLQNFWNSGDWKAIRAYNQIPELQHMTLLEMQNNGLFKERPARVLPRRSDRIKAIERHETLRTRV